MQAASSRSTLGLQLFRLSLVWSDAARTVLLSSTSDLRRLCAIRLAIEFRLTVRLLPSSSLVDALAQLADALKGIVIFRGQHAGVGLNGVFSQPGVVEVGIMVRLF